MKRKLAPAQEFIQRLDAIDAQTPLDEEQVKVTLREAGIKPGELLARARTHIKTVRSSLVASRLAQAEAARKSEADRLLTRAKKYAHLSIDEIRSSVKQLTAKIGSERLAVAHKNLSSRSSREELEELLAEYEHLESEHTNGED